MSVIRVEVQRPDAGWTYTFHHPYHRLTRPDVTGQSARFRRFFLTPPIALSGSRPTERLWGRVRRPQWGHSPRRIRNQRRDVPSNVANRTQTTTALMTPSTSPA